MSITPFGETGPKAGWPATDLTVLAAGCQLAMTGDDDRPPVRTVVPQAFLHACADAAAGAMVALAERADSGLGQHVEVSAQRSVLQATQSYVLAVPLGGTPGAAQERRREDRRARHPAPLAVQGRLRLGHVPVRRVDGPVHAAGS